MSHSEQYKMFKGSKAEYRRFLNDLLLYMTVEEVKRYHRDPEYKGKILRKEILIENHSRIPTYDVRGRFWFRYSIKRMAITLVAVIVIAVPIIALGEHFTTWEYSGASAIIGYMTGILVMELLKYLQGKGI